VSAGLDAAPRPSGYGAHMPVHLNVREVGVGTPLVLLHAFPLSSAMWMAQREGLQDSCRVLTPDLRGFGGSTLGDDAPDMDLMADDVAAAMDTAGVPRAVVGGLSMGGYVVMALLRRHPERVAGVVLADTKAGADADPARENRERVARALLDEGSSRVLVDDVLPGLLGATTTSTRPLVFGRVKGLVQAAPPAAAAWAQRAMAGRPDSTDTLAKADVPALVLVGDEDGLTPPDDAEALAESLPEGRLVRLEGAGHLSALEVPEAFNDAVRGFVAGVDV
jgi:pimeloyl-ACP methyl ester carboxylesterase